MVIITTIIFEEISSLIITFSNSIIYDYIKFWCHYENNLQVTKDILHITKDILQVTKHNL